MNLHAIANAAISAVNPNEIITLYQAVGQQNVRGLVTTRYLEPQKMTAQVQSEGNAALQHSNNTGQSAIQKRFYVHTDASLTPLGLMRQKNRSGDFIKRADGTFWLVTSMPDDFSSHGKGGWVCLVATLQTVIPDFSNQDWYIGDSND